MLFIAKDSPSIKTKRIGRYQINTTNYFLLAIYYAVSNYTISLALGNDRSPNDIKLRNLTLNDEDYLKSRNLQLTKTSFYLFFINKIDQLKLRRF